MFKYFFKREINDSYLGNLTGLSWILIQPIITVLIYWFVFEKIFHSKLAYESEKTTFIVYLAVGFWPWIAFSESLMRSITAVYDKKDLIGKVQIDFKIPVIATITATFSLHMIGYFVVLFFLYITGNKFNLTGLVFIVFPILQLYFLAIALGILFSSLQIFIKDLKQILTTLITLWFFLTPIVYSEMSIPAEYSTIIKLNPLYIPISFIHNSLVTTSYGLPWKEMFLLSLVISILLYIAVKTFNKLQPSFEDFK